MKVIIHRSLLKKSPNVNFRKKKNDPGRRPNIQEGTACEGPEPAGVTPDSPERTMATDNSSNQAGLGLQKSKQK